MTFKDPFVTGRPLFKNFTNLNQTVYDSLTEQTYLQLWCQFRDAEFQGHLAFDYIIANIDRYQAEYPLENKQDIIVTLKSIRTDEIDHINRSVDMVEWLNGPKINQLKLINEFLSYKLPSSLLAFLVLLNLSEIGGVAMLSYLYRYTTDNDLKEKLRIHLKDESQHVRLQQQLCSIISQQPLVNSELVKELIFRPLFPWLFRSSVNIVRKLKTYANLTTASDLLEFLDTDFYHHFFSTTIKLKYSLVKLVDQNLTYDEFEKISLKVIRAKLDEIYQSIENDSRKI